MHVQHLAPVLCLLWLLWLEWRDWNRDRLWRRTHAYLLGETVRLTREVLRLQRIVGIAPEKALTMALDPVLMARLRSETGSRASPVGVIVREGWWARLRGWASR